MLMHICLTKLHITYGLYNLIMGDDSVNQLVNSPTQVSTYTYIYIQILLITVDVDLC